MVEFAFSLNNEDLINKKWTKYILRKSMDGILDKRINWRKDKMGFNSPIAELLSNELKEWTYDTINKADDELFDKRILYKEYKEKILNNQNWADSLDFWIKLNTIKLINIYRGRKYA